MSPSLDAFSKLAATGYTLSPLWKRNHYILDVGTQRIQSCTQRCTPAPLYFICSNSCLQKDTAASQWRQISFPQGLHSLNCHPDKRHPKPYFCLHHLRLPEILLPDDVGPGADAAGQDVDTEEGAACPLSELAWGVWKTQRCFKSTQSTHWQKSWSWSDVTRVKHNKSEEGDQSTWQHFNFGPSISWHLNTA